MDTVPLIIFTSLPPFYLRALSSTLIIRYFDIKLDGKTMRLKHESGTNPYMSAQTFIHANDLEQFFLDEASDNSCPHPHPSPPAPLALSRRGERKRSRVLSLL